MFDTYGDERSAAFIMDFESGLLHDCFRYTSDPAVGIESMILCERSNAALQEDPFNLSLGEHNFAMRVYSLLREFGDAQLTLMCGRPGLRLHAIAAAEHALDYFLNGPGRDTEQASGQVARIQWTLGDLLSVGAGPGSVIEHLRSALPILSQSLRELESSGEWHAGSETPSEEDLRRAVSYLSDALESGQLREDWASAVRQSRVAAILDMKDAPSSLRRQAIDDLTADVASLEERNQPQAWIALKNLATFYLNEGNPEKALSALERACSRAIVEGDRVFDERSIHFYSETYCELFDTLARTYAELERPVDALCALEVLRGSTIRIHTMTKKEGTIAAKARQEQRYRDAVRDVMKRLGEDAEQPQERPLSDALSEIWGQVANGIRLVGPNCALVSICLWRDSVLALIARSDADGGILVRSRIWSADVTQSILRIALTPLEPSTWRERRLQMLCDLAGRDLWFPLKDDLRELGITDTIISAPGTLSGIPFEGVTLSTSEETSIRPIVTYLPAIRLVTDLARAKPPGNRRQAERILAVQYQGADLPYANRELEMLEGVFGGGLVVLDSRKAGKQGLLRALSAKWDVVHFACHGTFDSTDPWNSALHLTPDPERDDQRLAARDLLGIRLKNFPTIVLSACSTALTSSSAVNDAAGLIGGFLRAGASGIVATRWPVYDDTAFKFMTECYSAMRNGIDPSRAVYGAQERLRADSGIEDWAAYGYIGL
jgi:hypothetical protein